MTRSAFAYSNRAKHTWNNAVSKAQKEQPPQSRRYIGVHRRGGKWGAAITEGGQQFFFGVYPTEDQAARAYDEGRIFLHKKPVNFSLSEYHVEEVRRHSTLEEFARQKRQAIKSAGRIILASRFQGVYARQGKWGACAYLQRQHFSLGGHRTEEEAAKAVDRALIYTGKPPVNFPECKYDTESIQQAPHWAAFVEQCQKEAEKASKALQHSKYTGVSWYRGRWEAYLNVPNQHGSLTVKKSVGHFGSEVAAAVAADRARVRHGQEAVNFPDRMP
ncbi:hypothetical protein WJX82_003272 [Trebouxia sp. C0006]